MNFELILRVAMIALCVFLMLGDLSRARTPSRVRVRVRRNEHDRN
jgi:hypothetical protein